MRSTTVLDTQAPCVEPTLSADAVKKLPNHKSLYIFGMPPCATHCNNDCQPQPECKEFTQVINEDLGNLIAALDEVAACYLDKVFVRNADSLVSLGRWQELVRYLQRRSSKSRLFLEIDSHELPPADQFEDQVIFMQRVTLMETRHMNIDQYECHQVGLSYHLTDANFDHFLDIITATYQPGYSAEISLSLNTIGRITPKQLITLLTEAQKLTNTALNSLWLSPLHNLVAKVRCQSGLSCYRRNTLCMLKTTESASWQFTHELPTHFLCSRCELNDICDKSILFFPSDLSARRHCTMYRAVNQHFIQQHSGNDSPLGDSAR